MIKLCWRSDGLVRKTFYIESTYTHRTLCLKALLFHELSSMPPFFFRLFVVPFPLALREPPRPAPGTERQPRLDGRISYLCISTETALWSVFGFDCNNVI